MEVFEPESKYLTRRYKLFWVDCKAKSINICLQEAALHGIPCVNVGKELAQFLSQKGNSKFLSLETEEELKKIISQKSKLAKSGNLSVSLYNLGILLEPNLKIDATKIIKELSKEISIIILWEGLTSEPAYFYWTEKNNEFGFNFSETNINKIIFQNEI